MHLVGFVIRIYHNSWSPEHQNNWLVIAVRGVTVHQDIMAASHSFTCCNVKICLLPRAPLGMRRDQPQSDYSRPPSYRSRTSSTRPTLDPNGNTGCSTAEHSRDPSLSLSESGGGSGIVNVISVVGSGVPEPEPLDNIKLTALSADQDVPLRMMTNKGSCHSSTNSDGKDGNLVTIVQTGDDSSPVIVTVSGSTVGGSTSQLPATGIVDTEMEILAHL